MRTLTGLKERTHGLPERVLARVNAPVRARDGTLTVGREATAAEVAQLRAQGQRIGPGPTYIDDVVGHLEGLAALYPRNDLHELLVKRSSNRLQELAGLDIATLPDKHRKTLAKDVLDIEPALTQAAEAIAQGQRLLTRNQPVWRLCPSSLNGECSVRQTTRLRKPHSDKPVKPAVTLHDNFGL